MFVCQTKILMKVFLVFIFTFCFGVYTYSQTSTICGNIVSEEDTIKAATISLLGTNVNTIVDSAGKFCFKHLVAGNYKIKINALGYEKYIQTIYLKENENYAVQINLNKSENILSDIVISGTLKEVKRAESSVPVEVYNPSYFKKNPTPSIYDALQNVNGVRPQLNCNVCNTGDIHINGLEGPYTMILIDGMPIVSSLATVYGLSGIPNSIVERIEIVKGPASSLYGSEAVGGLINVITKKTSSALKIAADVMVTSWQELNGDVAIKSNVSKKAALLTGINFYKFNNVVDNNNDNFTDVTLQNRISIFQKWNFQRKSNQLLSVAARYFNEDRWGGDIRWTKAFRGSDSIYGESIYTKRFELLGNYQLPTTEKIFLAFSYNSHLQDSRYGTTIYDAQQRIVFSQITWDKTIKSHDLLLGAAIRYTFYDDNTAATATLDFQNQPSKTWLPGIFVQDEISISAKHKLLLGFRYDYNNHHGNIYTPRIAYKWSIDDKNILRINAGTGFRVVNLFTEDHAALTGARIVEIKNELQPEKSYNININFLKKIYTNNGSFIGIDFTSWYTYFNNRIIGDYNIDPNKIIYDNLNGFAESKGISANLDINFINGLKVITGATFMDVTSTNNGVKNRQLLTEKFTGTWAISYKFKKIHLGIDYTGNIYGPMALPLLGKLDPRLPKSPTWSIQNIQFVYSGFKNVEVYAGVKNLLNFLPTKNNPFIIARSNDPFDKNVQFDASGKVIATAENPYALTFDTSYVYAPNQGVRGFAGLRYSLK